MRTAVLVSLLLPCAAGARQAPTAALNYYIQSPVDGEDDLRARFTAHQLTILEMLNRADAEHLSGLEQLVVPVGWHDDLLAYSPLPMEYGWRADSPRLLVVDQASQAFGAYEGGYLVRWGPVSTGRAAHPTPAGLFHLNWRSRGRHSTVDPDWYMPWYFNFQNDRGLSFHEYALPGRPASHACVRLLERDAQWLFDWGETWTLDERGWTVIDPGTPVLILGCYAYGEPPPWRSLDWLARGVTLPSHPRVDRRSCAPAPSSGSS